MDNRVRHYQYIRDYYNFLLEQQDGLRHSNTLTDDEKDKQYIKIAENINYLLKLMFEKEMMDLFFQDFPQHENTIFFRRILYPS
ncbi:hypothetical protein [Methylobacter sp.]|uniref:hypothetical protein n=1 Tax=Methylobacter sp. TaxID=2051955 RepID=UPI003DA5E71E